MKKRREKPLDQLLHEPTVAAAPETRPSNAATAGETRLYHGQTLFNTFARPFDKTMGDMQASLTKIWNSKAGFAPADQVLLFMISEAAPGFPFDEKIKNLARHRLAAQDPFSGFYSGNSFPVNSGLLAHFAKTRGLEHRRIELDIGNLKGMNLFVEKLFKAAGEDSDDAGADVSETSARRYTDLVIRAGLTIGTKNMRKALETLPNAGPNLQLVGGRTGGDELAIELTIPPCPEDATEIVRKAEPGLWLGMIEASARSGALHIPHPKRADQLWAKGLGLSSGITNPGELGSYEKQKTLAHHEQKLTSLLYGAILHRALVETDEAADTLKHQFSHTMRHLLNEAPTADQPALIKAMHDRTTALLTVHLPGQAVERYSPRRHNEVEHLWTEVKAVADQLRPQLDSWTRESRTLRLYKQAGPLGHTYDGWTLDGTELLPTPALPKEKARSHVALIKENLAPSGPLGYALGEPLVYKTPDNPFIRPERPGRYLYEMPWAIQPTILTQHVRALVRSIPPAVTAVGEAPKQGIVVNPRQQQTIVRALDGLPPIDPTTGLLGKSNLPALIERFAREDERLRAHPEAASLVAADSNRPLSSWLMTSPDVGVTALNAREGHGSTDRYIRHKADLLIQTATEHGLSVIRPLANGKMSEGNTVLVHTGAGEFMLLLPAAIRKNGQNIAINPQTRHELGRSFARKVAALNNLQVSDYLAAQGQTTPAHSKGKLKALKNPRNKDENGIAAFYHLTRIGRPSPTASWKRLGGKAIFRAQQLAEKMRPHLNARRPANGSAYPP